VLGPDGVPLVEQLVQGRDGAHPVRPEPNGRLAVRREDRLGIGLGPATDRREERGDGKVRIAVPILPHIANFDDLDPLAAEADIDLVRTRMQKDQQRLDAGQVSSPRELENLQSEIESLKRRQSDLEDEELEIMEKREVVQTRLQELRGKMQELGGEMAARERRVQELETELQRIRVERLRDQEAVDRLKHDLADRNNRLERALAKTQELAAIIQGGHLQ